MTFWLAHENLLKANSFGLSEEDKLKRQIFHIEGDITVLKTEIWAVKWALIANIALSVCILLLILSIKA